MRRSDHVNRSPQGFLEIAKVSRVAVDMKSCSEPRAGIQDRLAELAELEVEQLRKVVGAHGNFAVK